LVAALVPAVSIRGALRSRPDRAGEQRQRAQALKREVAAHAALKASRQRHVDQYRKLVDAGSAVAHLALEEVSRIDGELLAQEKTIRESEARLAEWRADPDVDEVVAFYEGLVALIQGRVDQAEGASELNAVLHDVLGGIWMAVADGQLKAEFALRKPIGHDGNILTAIPTGERVQFDDLMPSSWTPKPADQRR